MEKRIDIGTTELYIKILGAGFPLFILHGGPGLDHNCFGNYFDSLTKDYTLFFVDQRGQGNSKKEPSESITTKQLAEDITKLASKLKYKEYAVIGHSFGAFVALEFAIQYPEHAKYVVLLNGIDTYKRIWDNKNDDTVVPKEIKQAQDKYVELINQARTQEDYKNALKELMPFYLAYPTDQKILEDILYQSRDMGFDAELLYSETGQKYGNFDVKDHLDKVTTKMLIVSGEQDLICRPYVSHEIHKQIKSSRLIVYPNCGHMTFAEKNNELMRDIKQFIKEK